MKSELMSTVIDHRMLMDAYSFRKYCCHIQMRARYCQPSHPVERRTSAVLGRKQKAGKEGVQGLRKMSN
jgi:hypothetical protein